jgi:hypothetical protein
MGELRKTSEKERERKKVITQVVVLEVMKEGVVRPRAAQPYGQHPAALLLHHRCGHTLHPLGINGANQSTFKGLPGQHDTVVWNFMNAYVGQLEEF